MAVELESVLFSYLTANDISSSPGVGFLSLGFVLCNVVRPHIECAIIVRRKFIEYDIEGFFCVDCLDCGLRPPTDLAFVVGLQANVDAVSRLDLFAPLLMLNPQCAQVVI